MLFKLDLKVLCLLLIGFVLIDAKNYNSYKKTTPKPPPKPTTTAKPTTAKPKTTPKPSKPSYPGKPSKPSYPSKPGGGGGKPSYGGGSGGGGSGGGGSGGSSKPMPYKFEYSANVGSPDPTGMISQSESGDSNGVVTGMYSLRDPDGRERTVIYKADSSGFRATVETNELPPDVPNPADVTIIGSGPAPSMGSSGSQTGEESTSGYGYGYETTPAEEEEPTSESGGYY